MLKDYSNFFKTLSKIRTNNVSIYCTGYPERQFLENLINLYDLNLEDYNNLIFHDKNYSIIKELGFDAISIWEYRKREKNIEKEGNKINVDVWGRIYKNNWYLWDGVFKNEKTLENWNYLKLPTKEKLKELKDFLPKLQNIVDPVLSLPGLFEKTWQSMGFTFFSKCLKKNHKFLKKVINYFSNYIKKLLIELQRAGAYIFIVADDCGYKNRTFISTEKWKEFFYDKYEEIIKLVHQNGNKIIIHSDGYISNMIETFISLKFDAVQSLEPNAGVDIFSLFKKYSDKICFIGNLDVSTILTFGIPKEVRQYTKKLIIEAKKSKSYLVISPTQQLTAHIRPENIKIMIETVRSQNI
ncbi:MAG: uroporphyrinogen decarboxylase family protein [Promethearchaeota archaeon]